MPLTELAEWAAMYDIWVEQDQERAAAESRAAQRRRG